MKRRLKKLNINRIVSVFLMAVFLFLGVAVTADAVELVNKNSEEYQEVYGQSAQMGDTQANTPSWNPTYEMQENLKGNILELIVSPFIAGLAESINGLMVNAQVDLSLDAIIYGRVDSTEKMVIDVAHFGLEKNNPYGIMGASLYRILKKFSYAIIPVVLMVLLLVNLFRNNRKGREKLKDLGTNALVYFLTTELVPYLLELYIYVRDVAMYITKMGLVQVIQALSGDYIQSNGLYEMMQSLYFNDQKIVYSLLLLGMAFAGIIYLWDYVKIALLVMATFGLFPVIVLLMFFKPKIVSDWFDIVIPNLTIPFLDSVLMMAPMVMIAVFKNALNIGPGFDNRIGFGLCLVLLCSIFVIKGIRDLILRKLFNFESMRGGGGAAMVLMAAARMMMSKGGNNSPAGGASGSGGGHASAAESQSMAEEQRERGNLMRDADSRIGSNDPVESSSEGSMEDWRSDTQGADSFLEEQSELAEAELSEGEADALDAESFADERGELSVPDTYTEESMDAGGFVEQPALEDISDGAGDMEMPMSGEDMRNSTFTLPESNNSEGIVGDMQSEGAEIPIEKASGDVPGATKQGATNPAYDGIRSSNEFRDLSDRDKARFENLANMDDMESRIQANNRVIEDAGYDKGNIRQQYKQEQNNHSELLAKENELKKNRDAITDTSSKEYQKADISYNEAVKNRQSSENRLNSMQNAYNAAQQNVEYGRNLERYRQVENAYAYNSGLGGMDNKVYRNANEFYDQKRMEQIVKRQADYRNFDSGKFNGILTPQEREEFYRDRASQQRRAELADGAKKVGKVVGGTLGAAAGMYGGASTMMAGAMIGGGVGGKTAEVTSYAKSDSPQIHLKGKNAEREMFVETRQMASETSANAQRAHARDMQNNAGRTPGGIDDINARTAKGKEIVERIAND